MKHILFPSLVYQARLNQKPSSLISELLIETRQIRRSDQEGEIWSKKNYPGGYTSYGSLDQLHQLSSTFEKLKTEIDRHVRIFIKDLDMEIKPKELQMTSCWVNVMPKGVVHSMHLHPLSVVSGSFYIKTPKNASGIKFEDPRLAQFMASPPRKKEARLQNRHFVELKPNSGEVVLFESWMKHEVPMNSSAEERISISFNYDWIRP